ncbi:hypothetical protein TRV_03669 [Trichophyton verrucosum HKI 0517]|uniref:Uncharacterized protein n=1 Tax=Trichophyton verrucosum (strain HKI 0517) TaxID=663202 RepID=D4D979_TRIVH|nr:uncharacterized protein TRV_03669 [Trichophyton verrucosum HKI 0517]EFE41600.1 hypothetical protein TRV_03669 [Trichophyton verrucosum HKI 0517]
MIKKRKRREKEKGVGWKKKRKNEGEEEAKKMLLHSKMGETREICKEAANAATVQRDQVSSSPGEEEEDEPEQLTAPSMQWRSRCFDTGRQLKTKPGKKRGRGEPAGAPKPEPATALLRPKQTDRQPLTAETSRVSTPQVNRRPVSRSPRARRRRVVESRKVEEALLLSMFVSSLDFRRPRPSAFRPAQGKKRRDPRSCDVPSLL